MPLGGQRGHLRLPAGPNDNRRHRDCITTGPLRPGAPAGSILIPAHNEEKVIERTVRAMLRLDYPADRLEILVVNDGSTDGTAAILDRLASEDARVRPSHVQPGEGGKGKSRALNLG